MTEKLSRESKKGILVSDFDGTMTKYDFYDLICRDFPEILEWRFWQQYEEGTISHFEALRSIFASIRTDERRIRKIVTDMLIEPKLADSIRSLEDHHWDVVIASAGCDWYIRQLLRSLGVSIPIYANPGDFYPHKGLVMRLPKASPFFSREIGINKVAVVQDALKKAPLVAFAGDGRPDLAPALLVSPKLRFAKSWLAKKLREIGEKYQSFESWSEIPKLILKATKS